MLVQLRDKSTVKASPEKRVRSATMSRIWKTLTPAQKAFWGDKRCQYDTGEAGSYLCIIDALISYKAPVEGIDGNIPFMPCSLTQSIVWVGANLGSSKVDMDSCPGSTAVAMYRWALNNPDAFWQKYFMTFHKVDVALSKGGAAKDIEDEDKALESLIDRARSRGADDAQTDG
jgi:hypothetical protein